MYTMAVQYFPTRNLNMLLPLLWVHRQQVYIGRVGSMHLVQQSTKSACNELLMVAAVGPRWVVGAHRVALVVAGGTWWLRRRVPVSRSSFFQPFVAAHQPFGCKREREGAGSCREAMATHTVASSEKTKASQVPSLASSTR